MARHCANVKRPPRIHWLHSRCQLEFANQRWDMNESIKATLGLVVAVCVLVGIMVWAIEPSDTIWWLRIGVPLLGAACLGILIWAQTRKDKAPDFLRRLTSSYFERDGFCFAIVPQVTNGHCVMQIYFQNRYERPCTAQILVRSSCGLFSGKADISDVSLGVSCESGAFGRSTIPWPIPKNLQGRPISLDLAASVNYPGGRGTLLRYRDGLRVGAVGINFWREGLQLAGALGGALVISRSARLKLTLPSGVSDSTSEAIAAHTEMLWKLGDPTP